MVRGQVFWGHLSGGPLLAHTESCMACMANFVALADLKTRASSAATANVKVFCLLLTWSIHFLCIFLRNLFLLKTFFLGKLTERPTLVKLWGVRGGGSELAAVMP